MSIAAQTTALDCAPPLQPLDYLQGELTNELRVAAKADYENYFDAAQIYLNCLAAAQDAGRIEVLQVLEGYAQTFGEGQDQRLDKDGRRR